MLGVKLQETMEGPFIFGLSLQRKHTGPVKHMSLSVHLLLFH